MPSLVHVSLESGKDAENNAIGVRYEYSGEEVNELSEAAQVEFLNTLNKAYEQIKSRMLEDLHGEINVHVELV